MRQLPSSSGSFAVLALLCFGAAATLPVACAFPSYTYDLPGTGGGTTHTSSSSGSMSTSGGGTGGTMTSSSGGGTGGTTTTTTTTITPCASADCSDPTCASSYACVPGPSMLPSGWNGYFALYDGAASGVPGCGGTWPMHTFDGNGQLKANPATCPSTCGAPSGGTCQVPELDINDGACPGQNSTCVGAFNPTTTACLNFPVPNMPGQYYYVGGTDCGTQPADAGATCNAGTAACNVSLSASAATVSGGSCAPSAPNPTLPPVTWGSTGQACGGATAGKGCSTGVCMPIPTGAFHSGICIMQSGEQQCPAGQFTDQHIFYTGTKDTRGCSAGTCGPPTSESCTVTFSVYGPNNTSCTGAPLLTVTSGSCSAFSGNPHVTSISAQVTGLPSGGSCTPVDGQPTGTVTGTGATTFCCVP